MQFAKIIGQTKTINSLIKVVEDQRISHAQLFLGQSGSGTFALALAYAQYIDFTNKQYFDNPDHQIHSDSCGKCPSCIKYEQLAHPDLHLFFPSVANKEEGVKKDPESYLFLPQFRDFVLRNEGYIDLESWYDTLNVGNKQGEINVRDATRIISNLKLKAYEADYKVTIIWCFDKLNHSSAPKLLKLLEEPSDNTLFFLITDNSEAILPTILSRTQLVKVPVLSNATIVEYLMAKRNLDASAVQIQALSCEGSLVKARNIDFEEDNKFENFFIEWTRATFTAARNISVVLEKTDEFAKWGREQQRLFFDYSLRVFRKSFHINSGVTLEEGFFEIRDERFRAKFPAVVTAEKIAGIYNLFEQADYHIKRNANPRILFFYLSLRLGFLLK